MILDTSVLICLLREERETARFLPIMNREYGTLKISAANYLETAIVVDCNDDEILSDKLDTVLHHFAVEIVPVTHDQVRLARLAYQRFGKGKHAAALNFGDCFSYALSRATSEPLLFKGWDFSRTDVQIASLPLTPPPTE